LIQVDVTSFHLFERKKDRAVSLRSARGKPEDTSPHWHIKVKVAGWHAEASHRAPRRADSA